MAHAEVTEQVATEGAIARVGVHDLVPAEVALFICANIDCLRALRLPGLPTGLMTLLDVVGQGDVERRHWKARVDNKPDRRTGERVLKSTEVKLQA